MKTLDVAALSVKDLHYYLHHIIAPRPIALVSTVDAGGKVNLSPFSFFNLFSTNPPICVFSPARRVRDNTTKHTLENLREVPECVIHMASYSMVQQTSLASTEYAKGVNEFEKAGFTELPSDIVRPPRVAESLVQMECEVKEIIALGDGPGAGNLVLAEIVKIHIADEVLNSDGLIDQAKLDLVARLGGDWYARVGAANMFKLPKPTQTWNIGFDGLPPFVRYSDVLTGNDLALLANVPALPLPEEVAGYLHSPGDLTAQLRYLADFRESRESFVHQRAKTLIGKNKIEEAWLTLLAGALYEEEELIKQ
jgi:flavin reductase (DIM6/NTAB) family NADH-FMN oxidoreductase RutF